MKRATRVAIVVTILLLHLYLALVYIGGISDFWSDVFNISDNSSGYEKYLEPEWMNSTDKAVVMAKVEEEDTEWVTRYLPDWQAHIYVVNNASAPLTTPYNKGHESMAYLTYIIDNYDTLPSTIAFIHAHEEGWWKAWHTDAPSHSNAISLTSLNLTHVQSQGYVNLRCDWKPGCLKAHRENAHVTEEIWDFLFGYEDANSTLSLSQDNDGDWELARIPPPFPAEIGAPCCAQFAVSSEQIRRRKRWEYERYRQWVIETPLTDAKSGRTMEFLWHIIFGKEAVFCPDPDVCHCEVYGRCPA